MKMQDVYIYIYHNIYIYIYRYIQIQIDCPQIKCLVCLQDLKRWLFVATRHSRTHIWNGETMLEYLNFLGEELRARRRSLNLDHSCRALFICDCATQHMASEFDGLREAWCSQRNAAPGFPQSAVQTIYIYVYDIYIYI